MNLEFRMDVTQNALNAEHLELQGSTVIRSHFDPVTWELDPQFRLTNYGDMKIQSLKLHEDLFGRKLLSSFHGDRGGNGDGFDHNSMSRLSGDLTMNLDCSITPLRSGNMYLAQTWNCISVVIDDPYMMGRIACANVLSNLYTVGIVDCDTILMTWTNCVRLSEKEREVVMTLLYEGFKECARDAGAISTEGSLIPNPSLLIGGVATKMCQRNELILPDAAVAGDVIVLTKPLGSLVAVSVYQWITIPDRWNRIKAVVNEEEVRRGYTRAMDSMARLNRCAAKFMHYYNAHCATDISSLGLLGHAQKLVECQKEDVSFVVHNLPVLAKMVAISKVCGNAFQLLQGKCPEISGGLLICLPREQAAAFCKAIDKEEGYQAWIIGIVEKGDRTARIIDKPRIIEVPPKDL